MCLIVSILCTGSIGGLCGSVDKRQSDESAILWFVTVALVGTDCVWYHQTEDTLSPLLGQCESIFPSSTVADNSLHMNTHAHKHTHDMYICALAHTYTHTGWCARCIQICDIHVSVSDLHSTIYTELVQGATFHKIFNSQQYKGMLITCILIKH